VVKKYILVEVTLSKDIDKLQDHIGGRAYTMDGVEAVRVAELDASTGAPLVEAACSPSTTA
jgi:hypothetical protein